MVSKNVNGGMVMPVSLNGTYDALLVVLDERDAGNDSFFKRKWNTYLIKESTYIIKT